MANSCGDYLHLTAGNTHNNAYICTFVLLYFRCIYLFVYNYVLVYVPPLFLFVQTIFTFSV